MNIGMSPKNSELHELYRLLEEAEKDEAAGKFMDYDEFMTNLRKEMVSK